MRVSIGKYFENFRVASDFRMRNVNIENVRSASNFRTGKLKFENVIAIFERKLNFENFDFRMRKSKFREFQVASDF